MSATSFALIAVSFVLSLLALALAARAAKAVSELSARSESWKASRVESLDARLTETEETLSQLANRVKMMRVRNSVNHTSDPKPNGLPDPHRDPDGWRAAMNSRLARGKLGL